MRNLLLAALIVFTSTAIGADEPDGKELRQQLTRYPHRILFESYEVNNWEICSMKADGSDRVTLTSTPKIHEMYPQSSPDGSFIAFLVDQKVDGRQARNVYVMKSDGSERKLVSERARQPCWSPDSSRIGFVKQEFNRFDIADYVSKNLFFFDLNDSSVSKHGNDAIHHLYGLSWSGRPDWLVSTVHGGMGYGHAILAIHTKDETVKDLKIPGCRPCLNHDSTRITWSGDDHTISVADINFTSNDAKVSNVKVIERRKDAHLYHPDFSPDGKYITYSVGPGGRVLAKGPGTYTQVAEMVGVRGDWDIYLRASDGTGPAVRLTTNAQLANKESEWIFVAPDSK